MKISDPKKIFTVNGIGAASGILYLDDFIYLLSDNGANIYKSDIGGKLKDKIKIHAGETLNNIAKTVKPDYEAIVKCSRRIFAFGSGSTPQRCNIVILDRKTGEIERHFDATAIYNSFKQISGLDDDQLNIEGAVKNKNIWMLFQRGNGSQNANGVFIAEDLFSENPEISYKSIALDFEPEISIGFTDAIMDGNHIYFLATAEDSRSTYNDGAVLGTWFGVMDAQNFNILDFKLISRTQKFEGVAILKNEQDKVSFLLCEDNDSEELSSDIYEIIWEK